MPTHITVPLPDHILRQLKSLADENFQLWLFIAQNDLLDEARKFLPRSDFHWDDPEDLPF